MKNDFLTEHRTVVLEKVKESALSVIPIVAIVVILCLTVTPLGTDLLLCFLVGAKTAKLRPALRRVTSARLSCSSSRQKVSLDSAVRL